MIAEYVPAGLISFEPGLMPPNILVAEALDLRRAIITVPAAAYRPFEGPVSSRPVHFGPERQPFSTEHAGHSLQLTIADLNIVLIAFAYGRQGIDCLKALGNVALRRAAADRRGAGIAARIIGTNAADAASD